MQMAYLGTTELQVRPSPHATVRLSPFWVCTEPPTAPRTPNDPLSGYPGRPELRLYFGKQPLAGGGQAITGYRATLVTPMLSDGALVGPIAMMRREAWPFTARGSLYAASPSRIRSDTAIPLSVVPRTRGDVPARSRCGIGQELGLPHPSVQTALAEQCLVGGQADRAAALENQDTTSPPER